MIRRLQQQRMQLQQRGVDAQVQELKLLRSQMTEQARIDEISTGFLRNQIESAQQNSAMYMQQLSLLGDAQQTQLATAERQNQYTSLLEREQNRKASNRASFNRNLVQRRQNARRQVYTSGVLTAQERRAI